MNNRLAGHSVPYEGRIFDGWLVRDGAGEARCSCGAVSPVLPSTNARRKWHREHKDEVRADLAATRWTR